MGMNTLFSHRNILKDHLLPLIGICLCIYFAYHTIQGERSVLRLAAVNGQIETLSQKSDSLTSERMQVEEKVAMMRPGSVDSDLLEERVRLTLGYKHADEYAVLGN